MQFIMVKSNMVNGVLVFVKCNICEAITNVSKHIVPIWNNLEKHMGNQQAKTKLAKHS
jgi:hypothetical protein